MRKSRLSAYKQHKVIEHFVVGTTARCASKFVNVNKNTAILCFQGLWEIIAHHREQGSLEVFDDEIDVDERYFGGTHKGKRGRGAGKVPVFGLLRRGGKVYTQIMLDAKSATSMLIMRQKIVPDSIVYTDCWAGYNTMDTQ